MIRHVDLFSGIGGFSLASEWCWGHDHKVVAFCEINAYCQQVLKRHWPGVPICNDIKEFNREWIIANPYGVRPQKQGAQEQTREDRQDDQVIDLITGGYPCQPFSVAGQRKGETDPRHLWPEMFRVITALRPRWVVCENVAGHVKMGLDKVITDLESQDYSARPVIIPACAVNAPHRRERVWIIANARCQYGARAQDRGKSPGALFGKETAVMSQRSVGNAPVQDATHSKVQGLEGRDTTGNGCTGRCNPEYTWNDDWRKVAIATCASGVDDGLPVKLDEFELTKAQHRVERLKALGNAIVPQVALRILSAIKEIDCYEA